MIQTIESANEAAEWLHERFPRRKNPFNVLSYGFVKRIVGAQGHKQVRR
jgi:hypothetical protein